MPHDDFADVARQLERKLLEMNQATDPALRRSILSDLRRLIAEADRLNTETSSPKKTDKPDSEEPGKH
jgi:TATA-binding protein-associated factor Taf7